MALVLHQGETKEESRSVSPVAFDIDRSSMGSHDSVTYGKPKPRPPLFFSRKERTKNMRHCLWINTRSGVGYGDHHLAVTKASTCGNGEFSSGGHSVHGIEKKIDQNLFQMLRIAGNSRQIGRNMNSSLDLRFIQMASNQLHTILNDRIHGHRYRLFPGWTGKIEQILDDAAAAAGFILDDFQILMFIIRQAFILNQVLGKS